MKLALIILTASICVTGCAAQRITCWNEATGQINYIGGYDNETNSTYVVDVADGIRDFYQKKNCRPMTDA